MRVRMRYAHLIWREAASASLDMFLTRAAPAGPTSEGGPSVGGARALLTARGAWRCPVLRPIFRPRVLWRLCALAVRATGTCLRCHGRQSGSSRGAGR